MTKEQLKEANRISDRIETVEKEVTDIKCFIRIIWEQYTNKKVPVKLHVDMFDRTNYVGRIQDKLFIKCVEEQIAILEGELQTLRSEFKRF